MIRFHVPYRTGAEPALVTEALAGESLAGNGPFTRRAQSLLEERTGAARVLLTTSCTAALELAAMVEGLGPGDEVIVPSFTFTSTAAAFLRTGASVVFADVDPATMMIDVDDAARRVTDTTKAICPVHYAGVPADLERLIALASDHGLTIIEDAAQALDATWNGRPLGTFGRFGALSFHATKNIQCGLGGALLINSPEVAATAEHTWERGTNRAEFLRGAVDKYTWVELGSSFYPSEMQSAFLVAQLKGLDENTRTRTRIWDAYREGLAPLAASGKVALQRIPDGARLNGHAFYVRCRDEAECEGLRLHLHSEEIDARTHYVPLHTSPMGLRLGNTSGALPATERYAGAVLRLPLHHELTDEDVSHVIGATLRFFE